MTGGFYRSLSHCYPECLNRKTWLEAFLVDDAFGLDERASVLVVGVDIVFDVGYEFGDNGE